MTTATRTERFKMMDDRVAVLLDPLPQFTGGGIALPDCIPREKPYKGTVVAVGPGLLSRKTGQRVPLSTKVGDRVILTNYAGFEVEIGGEKFQFLRETNIDSILVEE